MKKSRIIFIIVGLFILGLLFYSFGFKKTINDIIAMGWRFWIIILIFLFNNIFMTFAWKVLINHPIENSFFYKLLLARIAGDSTSSINAVAAAAGEAIKAMYIKDYVPLKIGMASVILDRIAHMISNLLMILTGIFISFFVLNISPLISIATFMFIVFLLYMIVHLLKQHEEGFIQYMITKIPRRWLDKFISADKWDKIKLLDEEISYIFSSKENLKNFYISLIIHYISGFIATTLEIYFIIKFSGNNIPFLHCIFLNLFSLFLTSIVFFMPANIGTSEGSYSLALKFLGYDPAIGLTIGIIRRLRTFVWAGIGVALLFYAGFLGKKK
jgi:glycosyltransferase 2 family protein